jgi:hypothetical protein
MLTGFLADSASGDRLLTRASSGIQGDAAGAHDQLAAAATGGSKTSAGMVLPDLWAPVLKAERLFIKTQTAMALGNWDEADAAVSSATTAVEGAHLASPRFLPCCRSG